MKKYAAVFALFGFCASTVFALWGEAPLEAVLRSGLLWGVTFGVIGVFLGHTASVLLSEGGIADPGDDPRGTENEPESGHESALEAEDGEESPEISERSSDKRSPKPIETDEVE